MIPKQIGPFRIDTRKTTMKYGTYYDSIFELPFAVTKKRHVRVYLPENYDFNDPEKRFPVIYFSDGQNLVNKYLSAYGDWELSQTLHRLYKEGYGTCILVGIDCPKNPEERILELNPPHMVHPQYTRGVKIHSFPYGEKYVNFVADKLKPVIDELFYTRPEKEFTGSGGSSMGGAYSFYAYLLRRDVFGFNLVFSPAFFLYKRNDWIKILDTYSIQRNDGRIYLYVGGKDSEHVFLKPVLNTYEYLKRRKFDINHLALLVDDQQIHHEGAWAKYSYDALKFWFSKIKE